MQPYVDEKRRSSSGRALQTPLRYACAAGAGHPAVDRKGWRHSSPLNRRSAAFAARQQNVLEAGDAPVDEGVKQEAISPMPSQPPLARSREASPCLLGEEDLKAAVVPKKEEDDGLNPSFLPDEFDGLIFDPAYLDAQQHVGLEADALVAEASAMALSGSSIATLNAALVGQADSDHVMAAGSDKHMGSCMPLPQRGTPGGCSRPGAAPSRPARAGKGAHAGLLKVRGRQVAKRRAPKAAPGHAKRQRSSADMSRYVTAMYKHVPMLHGVLGQKKVREARQLGWTLLRAARLREGPKPPEGYFRYHRTPQFEVLISGLLGVVCTYVKGHAGAPGTLHVAAQPASGLPVPVWGDKNWVIHLFNAMADKEVFLSGEELLERKLVCKEGEHAQSPYKAKFDLLADAGLRCQQWSAPLHPWQNRRAQR